MMRMMLVRSRLTFGCLAGVVFAAAASCRSTTEPRPITAAAPKSPAPTAPRSLYDRLGKTPAIEAVVGEFLKRVAADSRINGRFINTDLVYLRTMLVELVCSAT